jgi:hypothetical protein
VITVVVTAATHTSSLRNTALVSTDTDDPDPANNGSAADTTVVPSNNGGLPAQVPI